MFTRPIYKVTGYVRFQFRKTRLVGSDLAGIIQVVLVFPIYPKGSIQYGPYSTPIETLRSVWDERRSNRPSDQVRELNRQLHAYQADLEQAGAYLVEQQNQQDNTSIIDGPAVMDALRRLQLGDLNPISLMEVYHQFYASKQAVVEVNRKKRRSGQISEGTLKTYPKRWVLIQQFLLQQKRLKLPVVNVGYRFATELREWLQRQQQSRRHAKGYDPATIHKVIGLLKMLLTYALSKEYIRTHSLATFTTQGGSEANPKPLTADQMVLLETCELPPALRYICDSWLVAAELCFHYADYMEMPGMKLIRSESGVAMIQHDRVKQTGTSLLQTVNITPRAARLLEKYGGPKGLYYASSAYYSKMLKKIARMAGILDSDGNIMALQFGQGRDTGLTMRAIEGASGIQLSRMAGWTDVKQADKYIGHSMAIVSEFVKQNELKLSQPFLHVSNAS